MTETKDENMMRMCEETHDVGLELGMINVEGTIETEGGGVRDKKTCAMRRFKLV
jgi:hypothetical protein